MVSGRTWQHIMMQFPQQWSAEADFGTHKSPEIRAMMFCYRFLGELADGRYYYTRGDDLFVPR